MENKEKYPAAKSCRLGPLDQGQSADSVYLAGQVSAAVRSGQCPQGVYVTEQFIFSAEAEQTSLIQEIQNDIQP